MIRTMIATLYAALLCAMVPRAAWPIVSEVEYQRCEALQDHFIEARARQDADAMAAVFAQDAIRVTPDGVFQGRDAIRQNLDRVAAVGLHDFTAQRTVSRREGDLLFAAGTWHAKLGELPGMADLAIGLTACIAFWRDLSFKAAAVITASIFLLGDAIGHIRRNCSPPAWNS